MPDVHTSITPEESTENSTRMALEYFRIMGPEMRFKISNYLLEEERKKLNAVCRETYGPIGKAKLYKHRKKEFKWAKKVFSIVMKPTNMLFEKSMHPSTNETKRFGLFCLSGILYFPNAIVAAAAAPMGFFAGTAKEVKDKVKASFKEHHANKRIRPFDGEQIAFIDGDQIAFRK